MHRLVLRAWLAAAVVCAPWVTVSGQDKRAFEPGGAPTMVLAGVLRVMRTEEQVVVTGLSFTTDASGRLVDAGGTSHREKVDVLTYEALLYVDSAGISEALKPFAGQRYGDLLDSGRVQEAVRAGTFPKVVVLRFTSPQKARVVRDNVTEMLRTATGDARRDVGRFTGYLRKDFQSGDSVEVRFVPGGKVVTTMNAEVMKDIENPAFAQALLGGWLAKDSSILSRLRAYIPPAPGA